MTYFYHPLSQEHRTGIWKPGIPPDQLLHQEHGYTCVYCEVVVVTEVSEGEVHKSQVFPRPVTSPGRWF